MKKQVHKESQIQGTVAEFALMTAGIQLTMLLKMATSFNLPLMEVSVQVTHETHLHDTDVHVTIKTDARGKGILTFGVEGFTDDVWTLGGMYAFRKPETTSDIPLEPYELVTCLNLAVLQVRLKYGEQVAS